MSDDILKEVFETKNSNIEKKRTTTDKIDAVVTNRFIGPPLFLAVMYMVFQLTFTAGEPMMGWVETVFGWLGNTVQSLWPAGSDSILKSLLVDGIIGGVGGVMVFLPNIFLLFLAIEILEQSGYMTRAAFIMDNIMNRIGLNGKCFIPMLIGFGCSIPAIMATRMIDNRRDRLTTMLVIPLMSCGARFPIYALIIPAFFPESLRGGMLLGIYLIGIILAIVLAKLLRSTFLKGESHRTTVELPTYSIPKFRTVLKNMFGKCTLYLKSVGTLILGASIILWALAFYPQKTEFDQDYAALSAQATASYEMAILTPDINLDAEKAKLDQQLKSFAQAKLAEEKSYAMAGRLGQWVEPVMKPMGFDWKISTALIGALAAKEIFIAQMGIVYSVGEADELSGALRSRLSENYSPLVGLCIMLFVLISAPCMATVAITTKESNSWKYGIGQFVGLTLLAWVLTVITFQVGTYFGF